MGLRFNVDGLGDSVTIILGAQYAGHTHLYVGSLLYLGGGIEESGLCTK